TQHSEMGGTVVVMEPRAYAEWLANNGESVPHLTMQQAGARKFNSVGCENCHGNTDTLRAPSPLRIYGKKRGFSDCTSASADDAYLRDAILDPYAHITAGYGQSMPVYKGQLTEDDILNLVAYIKSSGTGPKAPASSYVSPANIPAEQAKTNGETPLA